jgi:recombination protein RecR
MKDLKLLVRLTEAFHQLPGIGQKSAERMAYSILGLSQEHIQSFAEILLQVKDGIKSCPICGLYTEQPTCEICSSSERSHQVCIVVSYPKDVFAFEKIEQSNVIYHVLHGVLSPQKGIGPDQLNIDSLLARIKKEGIKEIVLATNPTLEGETTSLYLTKILEKFSITLSRLAYGLPMGGHLDYADSVTLSKALSGRTKVKGGS